MNFSKNFKGAATAIMKLTIRVKEVLLNSKCLPKRL